MSSIKRLAGPFFVLAWFLFCTRWFDAFAPLRPGWLSSMSPALPGWLALVFAVVWLRERRADFLGGASQSGLLLVVGLAVCFRLPLAWWGAWGYTTADGALSGIMALHIRDGVAHDVFVPSVAYSGSLKSHLTALVSAVSGIDLVRAFALASVAFYALFVAAAHRLGAALGGQRVALLAGLYAAFAPTFVTQYSLSNDGNYVEVLALGSWAIVLAGRGLESRTAPAALAVLIGILLGLGFWCHILVVAYAAAIAFATVLVLRSKAAPAFAWGLFGFALGDGPGLLWNLGNNWDSFRYLIPSAMWESSKYMHGAEAAATAPSLPRRALLTLTDHAPILFGYDAGYPPPLELVVRALAWLGVLAFLAALLAAARRALAARRLDTRGLLLVFAAANVGAALVALPHIPGNPRYLLFLFTPACVLVADLLASGARRAVLGLLMAFGALGSLGQSEPKFAASFEWRQFLLELRREGVRHCYTDYYIAARLDFFGAEDPLCSSKLGPITTEYFLDYRERVDRAASVDIVAVNATSAARIERKLKELNVAYERRNLMKPVLLRLSRRVDPRELFPGRDFRAR